MEGSNPSSTDAFDLLYLQEDEYYFQDYQNCTFSTTAIDTAAASAAVTLKLCSASIYLVSHDQTRAIIRIPLDAIESITPEYVVYLFINIFVFLLIYFILFHLSAALAPMKRTTTKK